MLKVNEYFDGNVKSIGFSSAEGDTSVGVMQAGEYEFGTNKPEKMTVISGEMSIKMTPDGESTTYSAGTSFNVPGSSKFYVTTTGDCAYLCNYID